MVAEDSTATDVNVGAELGFALPVGSSTEVVLATRTRLAELAATWRELDDGAAITLTFRAGDG